VASRSSVAATAAVIADFGSRYFTATLNGAYQSPPVPSMATGSGSFMLTRDQGTLTVSTTTVGLDFGGMGPNGVDGFHIHAGAAGVNGGIVWDIQGDAQTAVDTNAESFASVWTAGEGLTAQISALLAGNLYENIHTVLNGGGEIRGQVLAVAGD